MLLAIDTATRGLSLALHDGHALLAEQTVITHNRHNTLLAPAIQQMLAACGATFGDLTAVAVARGPGSYTGLRIGVALAKGIAGTANLPLIGYSTLDILALGTPTPPQTDHRLMAVVQAGRGRIIAGEYGWRDGRWQSQDAPRLIRWPELLGECEPGDVHLTGEIDATGREAITGHEAEGLSLHLVPAVYRLRRAGFMAEDALRRLDADPDADYAAAHLLPVYLKSPG